MIRWVQGFAVVILGFGVVKGSWVAAAEAQVAIASLTMHENDVPVRLEGFGIVVGLDGTGDRTLVGIGRGASPSAQAIANFLRSSGIPVPAELLRPRNVAAVVVSAEISPYTRAGSRFDVHVSSLQDATSVRGGRLVMMPLYTNPGETRVYATGSGGVIVSGGAVSRLTGNGSASGRIPNGGLLEVDLPRPTSPGSSRLNLKRPSVLVSNAIADAINAALGDGVAAVEDPGTIALNPPPAAADNLNGFWAQIDRLTVTTERPPRIIINRHDGTVATVGNSAISQATVSHNGITLSVGAVGADGSQAEGMVSAPAGSSVQAIAAGLHAAGARPQEISTIFEMLVEAGALTAEVIIR